MVYPLSMVFLHPTVSISVGQIIPYRSMSKAGDAKLPNPFNKMKHFVLLLKKFCPFTFCRLEETKGSSFYFLLYRNFPIYSWTLSF